MNYINNQGWYYALVKNDNGNSLMDRYSLERLSKMLTVCYTPKKKETETEVPHRLYTVFQNYTYYYNYIKNIPEEERYFYEIIYGEISQKIHFDIDISDNIEEAENIKDMLISSIIDIMRTKCEIDIDISKDILIYTSHSEIKRSYHILVDNYCVKNNIECRYFYTLAMEMIPEKYSKYIDHMVYGNRQNFRILGCTKNTSYRPKIFCDTFNYKGSSYKHVTRGENNDIRKLNLLMKSLVTFTFECKYLKNLSQNTINKSFSSLELSEEQIEQIKQILRSIKEYRRLEIVSVEGSLITLKSKGYYCNLCERNHIHEQPYIIVSGQNIHFICRRNTETSEIIGTIINIINNLDIDDNINKLFEDEDETQLIVGKKINRSTVNTVKNTNTSNNVNIVKKEICLNPLPKISRITRKDKIIRVKNKFLN